MNELLKAMQNVTKGPKTSLVGLIMFLGGAYMIYEDWKNPKTSLTYASIEVGIFAVGLYLFLSSDGFFLKRSTGPKEEKDEE